MEQHFDVVWIGTGQAVMSIVPRIVQAGKRVAVIEAAQFGGTCVNNGCTPTKTLVASAYAMHAARRGDEFGFSIGRLAVNFPEVMRPQQTNRRESSESIEVRLNDLTGGAVYKGHGQFVDDHRINVGDVSLTADTFVLHVGTRPVIPTVKGIEDIQWLTNETILDLDILPEHLAIVGGSYIALEFAQIFRRLGSRVTVLNRGSRLVSREDEDISDLVAERLTNEGIDVLFNTELSEVSARNGITMAISKSGTPTTITASHVLFAVGRIPNSDTLNLAAANVDTNQRGYIEVNEVVQSSAPHIYAVGDVNGRGAFTHTSVNDGEIFWDHYSRAIGANVEDPALDRTLNMRTVIYSMFIDPPLARVGTNETDARASGRNVLMATMPMADIARAREKRETHGLVKILVDADTEEILGATVFGTGGDEVIGVFAAFIQTGASYKIFRRVVFPHPTISELMPWMLDKLRPLSPNRLLNSAALQTSRALQQSKWDPSRVQ